jgi:hypothetical protein
MTPSLDSAVPQMLCLLHRHGSMEDDFISVPPGDIKTPSARILKTKTFHRFSVRSGLGDERLLIAVSELRFGLFDANLGRGVFKKRLGLGPKGKRSGVRTLVATDQSTRWFFLFGYKKSERANLRGNELRALQIVASTLLSLDDGQIQRGIAMGELVEVFDGS